MFFGSRKPNKSASGASHPSEPFGDEAVERQSRQWQTWRRSAQKVTRAWHEWLAADGRHRAAFYRRYISALTEEERAAAELELIINLAAEAKDASDCTSSSAGSHSSGTSRRRSRCRR
jgi:hypothetical protein